MKSNRNRTPRLFLLEDLNKNLIDLNTQQAQYLRRVLRLRSGDSVVLFNGLGDERHAVVDTLARVGSKVRVTQAAEPLPESPLDLSLLQAVAKGEAMDLIVQKAAELGVKTISPILTDFGVVRLDDMRAARRVDHWQKIAQSACEQCGRHCPPIINPPQSLPEALANAPSNAIRVTLQPNGPETLHHIPLEASGTSRLWLLVGPEGGLSRSELSQADDAGFRRVSLGPRVLRTETAAIAACTLAQALWGDLAA